MFSIHPLSRFESGQTAIRRPKQILEFCFDGDHKLLPLSDECLRYYYPPVFDAPWVSQGTRSRMNLSTGFDNWIKADESIDWHLDGLLQTIQAHEEALLAQGKPVNEVRVNADVVAWRGILTKIMTAQYDFFADFELNATCFQDTIYLELNHTHKDVVEQQSNNRQRQARAKPASDHSITPEMMQYWGYKFEALSTLPRPWGECSREEIESRDREIVNINTQYCSVVRTGIGNTSLILAGEVDCVLGSKPSDPTLPIPWVELKTSATQMHQNPNSVRKWENKLLRIWTQSFLIGVPKVVVGFRSPTGDLESLQELDTQKIPGQVSRGQKSWDGNVCISMTASFLEWLKESLLGKDGVWRVKLARNAKQIELFQIEETGTGRVIEPGFKAHRERLLAAEIAQKLGSST
ncbi:decapping endonuclease targeting mRNA [Extremus antarcticus]|uniref:Decapping nuclease n=1 Tax=Extremus antarcticus TaxID=702011 RepID=A0AAJ0G960_9PEZI|nr:decapping endonuclease targeting mRNA [Extremus antarcticus]